MGDVLVADGDRLRGIVTDRDIVVRAVAEARDLATTPISELCSGELTTLSPTDTVGDAVRVMRDKAVRRVPVVEGSRPVGIVALGDLAIVRDERSALAGISVAKPNR
jgi:CBS domain-containing protein